jgi:hypothetical protein
MYGDALDRFMDWAKFLDLHNDDIWEIGEITFDHFGRESSSIEGRTIDYLNSGDTYDATLIRDDGDVYVGTWGDWVEQVERDIAEREERYRCGWCGPSGAISMDRATLADSPARRHSTPPPWSVAVWLIRLSISPPWRRKDDRGTKSGSGES